MTPLCGRSQTTSPEPLTEGEKRQILRQLYELEAIRLEVKAYSEYVPKEIKLDEAEREQWRKAVALEQQATVIAIKERDAAEERARFYKTAYEGVTRKRGLGCKIWRFVTLGIARCR